jgi:hypothetical protein
MTLAIMDVASGQVREAGGFDHAKNIDPQWSQDGRSLYFLSDRQGITNVYRLSLDGGTPAQLTNILTGVSGITSLSPALSAADGRLVFSAYEEDGYNIYAMDTTKATTEAELIQLPIDAGVLPPRRSGSGPVYAALQESTTGLPPVNQVPAEPYKSKLSLDYAGQPTFGVGTDPFGTYAAGGVSFLFGDTLGNHILATSVQVTNRFDEFGGQLFYLNRTHRWNWGLGVDQTPYISSAFATGFDPSSGAIVEQEFRIKQIDRGFSGMISYPFNAARRVEFSGALRQLTLSEDVTDRAFDQFGNQLSQNTSTLATFPTLNLGEASAALVYDTSISGITSPIKGSRYRLELSQSSGSLTYTGTLVDYRTYLMPFRPYTFALRGLYFGRYGRDAEDQRLPTLYLGYPGLVRGYDPNSIEAGECGFSTDGSCPTFDRLIGSRVAIANAELRVPLWGMFGGDRFYGPIPVEVGVFGDSGVAWGSNTRPSFAGGDQKPISSVGAVMRINLLGFAVAEIDYVHPLNRPQRGWVWQFNLMPGF